MDDKAMRAAARAGAGELPLFGDIRRLVSHLDRVSICLDDASYENFPRIGEVPAKYDRMAVWGLGIVESEFPAEGDLRPREAEENPIGGGMFIGRCIEFRLSRPGPSARSVRAKLHSAASELDLVITGLEGKARERAGWASEDIANAAENLEDALGREGGRDAAGPLARALGDMESAACALAEAAEALPARSSKPLDWALGCLATARDCAEHERMRIGGWRR